MAQHLALVAVLVPDYDTGIAYFTQKLGFDLLEDTDMGGGKRWVRVAPQGAQTAFLLAEAKGEQRDFIGRQGGGRVWLFLHTDNFDADFARMQAAGVTFAEEPRSESYGKVAVFTDDFGNRWDLLQLKTA